MVFFFLSFSSFRWSSGLCWPFLFFVFLIFVVAYAYLRSYAIEKMVNLAFVIRLRTVHLVSDTGNVVNFGRTIVSCLWSVAFCEGENWYLSTIRGYSLVCVGIIGVYVSTRGSLKKHRVHKLTIIINFNSIFVDLRMVMRSSGFWLLLINHTHTHTQGNVWECCWPKRASKLFEWKWRILELCTEKRRS